MKRRNFIGLPLVAAGAGVFAYSATSDAQGTAGLRLTLLRLDGSDGTSADADRSDACWVRAAACGADPAWTRIALQGFVPAGGHAPEQLSITALFADAGVVDSTHELFRYAAANPAASKPIGFHAMRETFAGLRVSTRGVDRVVQIADIRVPLASGLYALLLDAPSSPNLYAYSGDRARPLHARFGSIPNHLVLSVAESV
jgi:hypothetical protein